MVKVIFSLTEAEKVFFFEIRYQSTKKIHPLNEFNFNTRTYLMRFQRAENNY